MNSIGKILSVGDQNLPAGRQICPGDRIQPINGATVEVACYLNQKILSLRSGTVYDAVSICSSAETNERRVCKVTNPANCINLKGPLENSNIAQLITPYGIRTLNPRPNFVWTAVAGATNYVVQVEGFGVNWSKQVQGTMLSYPSEQPSMQLGSVYKVEIIANKEDESFTVGPSSILILPSQEKSQQLTALIQRIKALNLSADESAITLDTAYMSQGLLNEAIEVLKLRISARTQNPTIYRILGDRYLEAGLPTQASSKYRMAAQYAKLSRNSEELAKAQAGLELSVQLPISTNPAQ